MLYQFRKIPWHKLAYQTNVYLVVEFDYFTFLTLKFGLDIPYDFFFGRYHRKFHKLNPIYAHCYAGPILDRTTTSQIPIALLYIFVFFYESLRESKG